jgi:hypothetical protein
LYSFKVTGTAETPLNLFVGHWHGGNASKPLCEKKNTKKNKITKKKINKITKKSKKKKTSLTPLP